MSKKISSKQPAEKTTRKYKQKTPRRVRKSASNKFIFVMLIVVVAIALIGCGIGYYVNSTKMEEVSLDDEDVVNLANKYFRGKNACLDYGIQLFSDGTVSAKDLSYDTKEQIAIDYAVKKHYDRIGFNELREIYALLFNDGSSLQEKTYYESTGGEYEKDGDIYRLSAYAACTTAHPQEMVCLVIDKAYKSTRGIKVITGLYSGTADTQYLYSGLNWDGEPLGLYGEINPAEQDLAKWEIVYNYDGKLGHYFLDHTKKL